MKIDISIYRGYMNDKEVILSGHVFKSWAPSQYSIERRGVKHAFSILKMFTIKPLKNRSVKLTFQNKTFSTKTKDDGYFYFRIPFDSSLDSGWHSCTVSCETGTFNVVSSAEILKPHPSKYGIISDIDDTILISHSSNIFKKLYVMLTHNLDKRSLFKDVPEHYQALSLAGQKNENAFNSFFYVSSSEWNLYSFIVAIAHKYKLPKAIILLKKIKKGLGDFIFTGGGNHNHKFEKINEIILFYPNLNYVLLGDDSQKDPYLYEQICKTFPKNIKAVYIRQTSKVQKSKVKDALDGITSLGIENLYYADSKDAIAHSQEIGIINPQQY